MTIGSIRQAGSVALHALKEKIIDPILGKFLHRSAAKTTPNASVAKHQSPPEAGRPDTPLAKRASVTHVEPRSIMKKPNGTSSGKGSIQFDAKLPPHEDRSGNKYDLRNNEQGHLRDLFVNTRPGRIRQFIYKLHLTAPSHPKKEIAQFKEYLDERATTLQETDDIRVFLQGEKLADCQVNTLLKEHQRALAESRAADIFVETFLAEESSSGEELTNNLKLLLKTPGQLLDELDSTDFYAELGADIGLHVGNKRRDASPEDVLDALNLRSTSELQKGVRKRLEEYVARFEADPEEAQDYVDTRASNY